ncbi:MAG: haloacid dehalogenase [Magnetococcales bacterium]|nr:haloacid dehalogenase [Magnetococcales bacterium]HIJ83262.1 HAD family phosphatase [Magnetococcales bacterium]
MLSRVEAILFDLDGVLWLSDRVHAQAYARVLAENNLPLVDYQNFAGRRTDQVFRQLLGEKGHEPDAATISHLTRQKQAYAMELLVHDPPIDPDAVRVVKAFSRRLQVALTSSASRAGVELFLRASGLGGAFALVLHGEDVQRAKPDPEIYLLALNRLGIAANKAVVVEDSVNGIQAAQQAGIPVIVRRSTKSLDCVPRVGVYSVIDSLSELLDAF